MTEVKTDIQGAVKNEIAKQFRIFFSLKKLIIGTVTAFGIVLGSVWGAYSQVSNKLDEKYASQSQVTSKAELHEQQIKGVDKQLVEIKKNMEDNKKELKNEMSEISQEVKESRDDMKTILKELGRINGKLENSPSYRLPRQ